MNVKTMRSLMYFAAFALSLALSPAQADPPPPITTFDGVVQTPKGEPVQNAHVLCIVSFDGEPVVATTDAAGKFHFDVAAIAAKLPKRRWQNAVPLIVKADGWGLTADQADGSKPTTVTLAPATELHQPIVDATGKPVVGTHFRLVAMQFGKYGSPSFKPAWFPEAVGEHFGGTTGPDGLLTIKDLPQGWILQIQPVFVDKPGAVDYAMLDYLHSSLTLGANAVTETKPLTLARGGEISGKVSAPSSVEKSLLKDITVTAAPQGSGPGSNGTAVLDQNGQFRIAQLTPGTYKVALYLQAPLTREFAARPAIVDVKAGQTTSGVTPTIGKGAIVGGKVTYLGTNAPAATVNVSASNSVDGSYVSTNTDAGGRYQLCIPGGRISLSAQAEQGSQPSSQSADVQDGTTFVVDLSVDQVLPPVKITGHVLKADGSPANGASLSVTSLAGYSSPKTVMADDTGAFSLELPAAQSIVHITASLGHQSTTSPVAAVAGDDVTVKLVAQDPATAVGTIVDIDGNPVPGIQVSLYHQFARIGMNAGSTTTDASGVFRFADLVPGDEYKADIHVDHYMDKSSSRQTAEAGKTIDFGNIKVVRADSKIGGKVVDPNGLPVADVRVTMVYDKMGKNIGVTDNEGRFTSDSVPNDKISLSFQGKDMYGNYDGPTGITNLTIKMTSTHPPTPAGAPPIAAPQPPQPKSADFVGRHAPEFQVAGWVNSQPISLASLHGNYVLIDAFGCCSDYLKQSQDVMRDFGSHGVLAIGLHVSNTISQQDNLAGHLVEEKVTMPVAVDAPGPPMFSGATCAGFGIHGYEFFVLIDRKGDIAYSDTNFDGVVQALGRKFAEEAVAKSKPASK